MRKETTLKLHTHKLFRRMLGEEIAGFGKSELLRKIAEVYCIAHDYSFELCNQLLDKYYEEEYWYICEKANQGHPIEYLIDAVLIRIERELLLAAVDGKTYFNNCLLDKNEPKGANKFDRIEGEID